MKNWILIVIIVLVLLLTSGCGWVKYMPTYDCEHFKYERTKNSANFRGDNCKV